MKQGDVIVSLEAMKMETALRSPRAAVIKEILASPGNVVEANDLLVILD